MRWRPRSRSIRAIAGPMSIIARVAEKQHLFGKAIRMTDKALLIEPNDPDAIAVQGEAMVEMGATARAQANLQKLQHDLRRQGLPADCAAFGRDHPRPDGRFGQGAGDPEGQLALSARASFTHSSTLSVSARRCSVDAERFRRFERARDSS